MLLEFNKSRLARYSGCCWTTIHVFGGVRGVRCIHTGLWCTRGALVGAPQIRKIKRVGAYRCHFIENFEALLNNFLKEILFFIFLFARHFYFSLLITFLISIWYNFAIIFSSSWYNFLSIFFSGKLVSSKQHVMMIIFQVNRKMPSNHQHPKTDRRR